MLLRLYLIAYFALVGAAFVALWQGQVLRHLPGGWVAVALIVAVALGLLLALVSFSRPHNPA